MKAAIITAVLGFLFMVGGFTAGMMLAPKVVMPAPPVPTKPTVPVASQITTQPATAAITPEALRKTSDDLFALNETLQSKKTELDSFERKLKERSEELKQERAALDRSHKKLTGLFGQLQTRLDLVESKQMDQVQKQVDLFQSMDMPQAIDLMRAMDDPVVVRMFTLMDTKPLAKLMAAWKVKYPEDTKRLLSMLADMARVVPKDKIAMANGADSIDPGPAPVDPNAPPDGSPATPLPDNSTAPAPAAPADGAPSPSGSPATAADAPPASTTSYTPDSPKPSPAPTDPSWTSTDKDNTASSPAPDAKTDPSGKGSAANAPD